MREMRVSEQRRAVRSDRVSFVAGVVWSLILSSPISKHAGVDGEEKRTGVH